MLSAAVLRTQQSSKNRATSCCRAWARMTFQNADDFCRAVLLQGDLASKLRPPRDAAGKLLPLAAEVKPWPGLAEPARNAELRLHKGAHRLPGLGALHESAARVACLRRFAHHELQAIELFA